MKRSYLYSVVTAAVLAGALAMSGCKAPTVAYQVQQTASLRVMNFAPNCTAPMDVYWDLAGKPVDQIEAEQAKAYAIPYGASSVYTNSIATAPGGTTYQIVVTPTRLKSTDITPTVTLMPGMTYTLLITRDPANPNNFEDSLILDQAPTAPTPAGVKSPTFVRFINLRPNVGALTVHVNDPVNGDLVTPASGQTFFQHGQYYPIGTAPDTSFAFIVTNANNQVITRLAYQTFAAGQYFTLVYAGDPCNTVATNPADTSISALDTFRLHAFDDNTGGNDQTNPIQPSFRYNIVNDIIPESYPYDPNHPDALVGFLVNGVSFSEFGGYSIPPVPAYHGGGEYVDTMNGVWNVNYQSAFIPKPLVVKGYATDATGSYQRELFNAGVDVVIPEAQLILPANNNKPWTLFFFDTVPSPNFAFHLDTSLASSAHFGLIPVPDVSSPDSVTFVFISGIIYAPPNASPSKNYTNFWLQVPGIDTLVPTSFNRGGGMSIGKYTNLSIPLAAGTSTNITVSDSIGGNGVTNARTFGDSTSFTAEAGGIYEIVSEGVKKNPYLLIMHVNAKNP
ncbi:MAG TPA: hypothetical protein VFH95_06390 [Candidatus Kapabacteria bacterium]|nr:hypothetical protein [Candidatus Kapabacteria bacterium]